MINQFFQECIQNKLKDEIIFKVAKEEGMQRPHKINALLRIMFIPVTFKNCILSLCGGGYWIYIFWYVLATQIFGSLYIGVGMSLENFEDILHSGSFWKKNGLEKTKVILGYVLGLGTVVLLVLIYLYTRRKIAQFKQE